MKGYSNFIQVRAGKGSEKNKVYVRGYASMPNMKDLYNVDKLPNGKIRTFRSLFTDSCVEDMRKQFEMRPIFVDSNHTLATEDGIINLAKKYNFNDDDLKDVKSHLRMKQLPLAKVADFGIDDKGLILGTETNPHFALADDDHKRFYDAVTGSLLDGYYKGYSINFEPVEFTSETDSDGNVFDCIDKIQLYGISYSDNPALPDNSFTEVCVRSLKGFIETRSGAKMEDEKKETVDVKKEEVSKPVETNAGDIKAEVEKILKEKEELATVEQQKTELTKQLEEVRKLREEIAQKTENKPPENKEGGQSQEGTQQSVVAPENKYGGEQQNDANQKVLDAKLLRDKLNEITKKHDQWKEDMNRPTSDNQRGIRNSYVGEPFSGFGELIQLQQQIRSFAIKKPGESDKEYGQRMSILNDTGADMSVKLPKRVN